MGNKISSVIAGVGSYVPDQIITTRHVNERLNGFGYLNVGKMVETMTGVKERRYVPDGMHPSDLAAKASIDALRHANMSIDDVDTIIFASCSRDLTEPATASIVQAKLGATNARRVMDLANACNSFLNGLEVMNSLIASGLSKVGLVVSGEKLSEVVNWHPKDLSDLKLTFASYTLGDGGGAFVLTAGNGDDGRGIKGSHFYSDGREWGLSVVMGGGTISPRNLDDTYFRCDSLKLNKLALKHLPAVIEEVLKMTDTNPQDVDLVIPHQVSYSTVQKLTSRFNYPIEKVMVTLDRFGNVGAASTPIALKEAIKEGRVGSGSTIMFIVGAAGFSAGAMLAKI